MSAIVSRPVPSYRVDVQRDGAWWDITDWVTRYTVDLRGHVALYVREALPVAVPAQIRISWRETVPAAAWADSPMWGLIAANHGIKPDVEYEGALTSEVQTITVDPNPPATSPPAVIYRW